MAEVKNAFLKAKMNKDVDDRLVPTGEYRHAVNVQVTTAESSDAGALQNVLGNTEEREFITADNCTCIGFLADENSDFIYLFFTDNDYADPVWQYHKSGTYSNNYIYKYNAVKGTASVLANGAFLNFHKSFPITGINLLEDLLFWTDNRNQPRKINVTKSSADHTTEDHISVAKYSPYKVINVFKESELAPGNYETTMKDVSSLFLPDGGTAVVTSANLANVVLNNINIPFYPGEPKAGMTVKKLNANNEIVSLGGSVDAVVDSYDSASKTVTLSLNGLQISVDTVLVFNPNPYYIAKYPGNPELNQDKFIRFSYRFKFSDGEYSLQAPFTQICFIPEQDGYFMTKDSAPVGGIAGDEVDTGDEIETVETTVVGFMQNKVNEIRLQVPLPTAGSDLKSDLHIEEIDILYSEANSSNTRIVETIPVEDLASSNEEVFEYVYQSKKPYKSLPNRDTTRVYDKIPVRALAQEVVSNRIVYANYQDKHTPPESLKFSVASGPKSNFNLGTGDAAVSSPASNSDTLSINNLSGGVKVGWIISGAAISNNTPGQVPVYIIAVQSTGLGYTLTLDTEISVSTGSPVYFSAPSPESYTTSAVEYPNHTLKTNRSYQVGLVLLDRFGRQSTVILSNSKDIVTVNGQSSSGSTFYAPYIDDGIEASEWFGNSMKILFEEKIGPESYDYSSYAPGVYNGDKSSEDYNPLGWYSYKIVVKQTEQEYYNVYTGGAIKGLPYNYDPSSSDVLRPSVSYISLVNDNINKVPRDLTKVGPLDKKFRSSVRLFGRVENHELNDNRQFYPGARSFTATSIEGLFDGFDVLNFTDSSHNVRPITARDNPFSAFYKSDSDPFIAEINTSQSADQQFGIQNLPSGTHTGDPYPKIDQLAIFETAPVESLLDIFWETSTSGLVSDLNFLIDTAGEELGASNITDWNTEPYTESIRENENVLNSPFTVKDAFGANVDPNAIESVSMSVGWVVTPSSQSLNPNFNTPDPSDLFELYEVSGSVGYYQIRVTDEHDKHIFYSGDQNIRRFVVYLTITLTGQQPTTVLKYLNLSNQPPHIDHDQHDCENPGVIQRRVLRNDDGVKAIFTAYNGADINRRDCANPDNGNHYTHPYLLQYEDLLWSITSIKNLNEHDPNIGATDYTGNSFNITVGPSQEQGQADNQGSQDEGAEVQLNQTWGVGDSLSEVNAYEFKLQVQDAGGSGATDEVTFEIDYRAQVTEVFSILGETQCNNEQNSAGAVYQGVGFVVTGLYGSGGGCYIVPSNNWSATQYLEEESTENNQINSRAISIGGQAIFYQSQNGTVLGQTGGWVYRNTRENAVDAFKDFYGRNWDCQETPSWQESDVSEETRELYTYFTVNSTDNL
jgi:hypothetical protein